MTSGWFERALVILFVVVVGLTLMGIAGCMFKLASL
jgi:hypothetical protein